MRSDLQFKLLQHLNQKKKEEGFTLIELLVVVIIIGVLAAVALPNLLSQVGKARETELKNAVGTVNRTQQSYHFERQSFAPSVTLLGVTITSDYITDTNLGVSVPTGTAGSIATVQPPNTDAVNDGTRAYSGAIAYSSGSYGQIMCQSDAVATNLGVPAGTTVAGANLSYCFYRNQIS